MRGSIVGLLAVALLCASGMSIAKPIVYNVHISDSTETVSGTITTDGTIGELRAIDITAWNLNAVGPVSFSIASTNNFFPNVTCPISGQVSNFTCGLLASSGVLIAHDAGFGSTRFTAVLANPPPRGTVWLRPDENLVSVLWEVEGCTIAECSPQEYLIRLATPVVIASVPDIEPSTGLLLGLAFSSLVFARKRIRGQQSTEV